ncbi:MAG: cytochrome c [Sandaracinaceae bacterium]|nr:cytochrome c [Sandaracinaceae bacterium]
MSRSLIAAVLAIAGASSLAACQGQHSSEPPIVPIRNMHEQPRYDAQEAATYFTDGRAMRPIVEHTVAQEMEIDPILEDGVDENLDYAPTIPDEVVAGFDGMEALLARGQTRFDIYCVPCHGALGDGEGMVPEVSNVATIRPPTFHDDRIRHMPDGQLYATIRNGLRNMPAYGHVVPVRDRWAIVGYVRALQLSQMDGQ